MEFFSSHCLYFSTLEAPRDVYLLSNYSGANVLAVNNFYDRFSLKQDERRGCLFPLRKFDFFE